MADFVKITHTGWYIGASTDTKPTGVPSGSTCYEHNTGKLYITYDGGTTWAEKPTEDGVIDVLGTTAGAAVITDVAGTIQQYLRGLVKLIAAKITVGIDQTTDGTTNRVNAKPFSAILEGGLTEIIDKDDTEVSLNDYSKSVALALGATYSGRIKQISMYATELGTGAVRANSGYLLIFDADPTVVAGDTALALADWQSCIAKVLITDWISDTGGGMATMEVDILFHAVANLYFVFQNLGTAFNDAAGDDEELHFNTWIKRES